MEPRGSTAAAGRPRAGRVRPGPVRALASPSLSAALVLALALLAAGCGTGEPADGSEARAGADRLQVLASVPPLGWFVEAVGGELVDVTVLVPPGASPAMYEPTHRQLRRLDRASLWVTVGHPRFPFDAAWRDRLTEGRPGLTVIPAAGDCRRRAGDPHVWASPTCARKMVDRIAGALIEARPSAADSVRARRRRALATVEAVERDLAGRLTPHRGRAFLVFHPALGYLARDFGLEQMAIQRGATEPNPAELDRLVRRARDRGIRHVFVQPQFSREAAALVADALPGGRVVVVDPLARSWPEAMRSIGRSLAETFEARPGGRTGP